MPRRQPSASETWSIKITKPSENLIINSQEGVRSRNNNAVSFAASDRAGTGNTRVCKKMVLNMMGHLERAAPVKVNFSLLEMAEKKDRLSFSEGISPIHTSFIVLSSQLVCTRYAGSHFRF